MPWCYQKRAANVAIGLSNFGHHHKDLQRPFCAVGIAICFGELIAIFPPHRRVGANVLFNSPRDVARVAHPEVNMAFAPLLVAVAFSGPILAFGAGSPWFDISKPRSERVAALLVSNRMKAVNGFTQLNCLHKLFSTDTGFLRAHWFAGCDDERREGGAAGRGHSRDSKAWCQIASETSHHTRTRQRLCVHLPCLQS
jgi:hypothetical protein